MIKPIPLSTDNPSGALIGYENLLTASTTTDADKALTPNTYERYRPTSGAKTVKWQMASAADVDFIAIAAHALSGESFTIGTAATVGGAITDVEGLSPTDNGAIMLTFETRNIQEVIFTSTLAADSEIGVISAGKSLQMERSIYGGHSPITLSGKTEYQSIQSESGQFLGRTIKRKGLTGSFSWQYLDPEWYRNNFNPFVESARKLPFFIKWRPDRYSDEVAFGHTTKDIKPLNMGGGSGLMSVQMSMLAHADVS